MDDGVRILRVTQSKERRSRTGRPFTVDVEHAQAWCSCGWEWRILSRSQADRHLVVHRWLEHDGPEPRFQIPASYKRRVFERICADPDFRVRAPLLVIGSAD